MDGSPDGPAARGDVWIDVSQPAPNAGIVDLVDDRDRVSGKVQRVRVVVGTFGGIADLERDAQREVAGRHRP